MCRPEIAHLELLAEVDSLLERLRNWVHSAPTWQPAEICAALVERLTERAQLLQVRLEAPLVVATLGGTGTGKSALINALLGAEVAETGRRRPTTMRPMLICRPDLTPQMLGIDPRSVEIVHRDLPALRDLVLIDCPDPDTTETTAGHAPDGPTGVQQAHDAVAGSNLARLRQILPLCDVILVTTTQQKYRSARVAEELAAAASGARLVFVQTHADVEDDIRNDWRAVLDPQYATGHLFFVDSPSALALAQGGMQPQGEFAELVDLLTRQLAGAAAGRIRRANFLDLAAEVLARCRERVAPSLPAIRQLQEAIQAERARLAAELAGQMRSDLLSRRRPWEHRLLTETASRWGFSPFALVLRIFQGIGGMLSGALLLRARTPAQLALWGAFEGTRTWRKRSQQRHAQRSAARTMVDCWDPAELRAATLVLEGYSIEAGLPRAALTAEVVADESQQAGAGFVTDVSAELEAIIARLAARHTGWFTRLRYEFLLIAVLGALLYRLGRNFFYDSWFAPQPVPMYGLEFYLTAAFWLILWCLLLVWALSRRLRRGLRREIDQLVPQWTSAESTSALFANLEQQCQRAEHFQQDLDALDQHVARLQQQLAEPQGEVSYRR
jgi:hypothetical protein